MCTHDQLWGTPWPGLIDDLLGRGWCWQPVKAQFSGWLAVPELSDYFVESCSQTAACPSAASSFGLWWVRLGSLQASKQQPSVLKSDYALMFHVTASWQECVVSLGRNDEMYLFFETIIKSKQKQDELNLPRDLLTDQKGHKQQKISQASFSEFSGVHLHAFGRCCSFR